MDAVFLKILNMSLAAGWLIIAVVALRFLLRKAPKWLPCVLWAIVAIRLICPFSFESILSLIPSAETVSLDILYTREPVIHSGISSINSVVNPVITGSFTPTVGASVNPLQIWTAIASYVWLFGVAAMLLYVAISFLRLRKKATASLNIRDNIWICDDIKTPFILGIIKPRIYLPSGMDETQQIHVIAHESAHLKRRDHWWKPLGFLLLAVYWFNPLCWLAYIFLCRDIELACDEKVIRTMGKDDMIAYSEALLSCSVPRRLVMACPLAFGEVGVKERIKTVLNYKKPTFWIVVAAVAACVVVAVCFLTNPVKSPISFSGIQITWANALDVRPKEPIARDLSDAQLDELNSRLLNLNVGRRDSDFGGFTPMYSLSIKAQGMEQFMIGGYDIDGKKVALAYEGEYYRINDDEFSHYLSAVCAGEDESSALVPEDEAPITSTDVENAPMVTQITEDTNDPNTMSPTLMVDGKLYYLSGLDVNIDFDKDYYDGQITTSVNPSQLPVNNDESNIAPVGTPYVKYSDGVLAMIGEKWMIFESDTKHKEVKDYDKVLPTIMVGDRLYFSQGVGINVDIDKSEYLGTITSAIDDTKMPLENGQANFEAKGAPYAVYKNGVILLLEGKWFFFEIR